jgi:hypothetical protein
VTRSPPLLAVQIKGRERSDKRKKCAEELSLRISVPSHLDKRLRHVRLCNACRRLAVLVIQQAPVLVMPGSIVQ